MRTILLTCLFISLLVVNPAFSQTTPSTKSEKPKSVVIAGEVRAYEPGKSLEVDLRPMVSQRFDLASSDTRYTIDPEVKVGSKVEITESKSDAGEKLIDVRVK